MQINCCISICRSPQAAMRILQLLRQRGYEMRMVSVIGSGSRGEWHPIGFYNNCGEIGCMGAEEGFWKVSWMMLERIAFFCIPEVGTVAAAGKIVDSMVKGMESGRISDRFGIPGSALYLAGVPTREVSDYVRAIRRGRFLVLFEGEWREVGDACDLMQDSAYRVTVHTA